MQVYANEVPRTLNTGSPVSEKNSSRQLGDQARLPTPRYLLRMRVCECRFPRMSLLGSWVNRGYPPPSPRSRPVVYVTPLSYRILTKWWHCSLEEEGKED